MPLNLSQPSSGGVTIRSVPIQQLIRAFNLANMPGITVRNNDFEGKIDQSTIRDPELYKSALGTPVVINLKFKAATYTDLNTGRQITTEELTFDTVLCTVSQTKNIVKTEIQGKDGTVKEYIGMGDYALTINGIICGPNGSYPASDVLALKRMLDAPVAIDVVSSFLNNLGIFSIVVDDYTLPQEAGSYSKQDFSINASSDTPLQLQIS